MGRLGMVVEGLVGVEVIGGGVLFVYWSDRGIISWGWES